MVSIVYGGTESVGESWLKLHLTDKLVQQVRRWLVLRLTYSEIKLVIEFDVEQTKWGKLLSIKIV